MQCVNVWGDLTRHQYTLSGLVLQKSWGVFYRFVIRGVQIDFTKAHRVLCGATFVECGLILLELRGFFFVWKTIVSPTYNWFRGPHMVGPTLSGPRGPRWGPHVGPMSTGPTYGVKCSRIVSGRWIDRSDGPYILADVATSWCKEMHQRRKKEGENPRVREFGACNPPRTNN